MAEEDTNRDPFDVITERQAFDKSRFLDATIEALRFGASIPVTIASGSIIATNTTHTVAAETGTTDDLTDIDGWDNTGLFLILRPDSGDTITIKHNGGSGASNIKCYGDADIAFTDGDVVILLYDPENTEWQALGNAAGSHTHANDHLRSHDHSNASDDSSIRPVSIDLSTFLQMSGETLITVSSSPQNNFNPNSVGATMAGVLVDPDTVDVTISGMVKAGDGHMVFVTNRTGTNDLILEDEGAGSTASNRFTFSNSADITLKGDEGVWLRYDANTSRWKCIGEHRPQAFGTAANDHAQTHDYDTHDGGVPFAELEYDDATSDPLVVDGTAAADGTEDSAARKDHRHDVPDASTSAKGIIEIATAAEVLAGVSTSLPVTPLPLAVVWQGQKYVYVADTASDDDYLIALVPALAAYAAGQQFHFQAQTANTGAATLKINSLAAIAIKKHHDQDLANGDIEAGQHVLVEYDGTNFQMLSQLGNAPAAAHNEAHGPSQHTEGNADKILYLDSSGDEQEVSLVAAGSATLPTQFVAGAGTTSAPAFKGIEQSVSITIETPVADDNITIRHFSVGATIQEIHAIVIGTGSDDVTFNLYMDATRTTESTKVFSSDKVLGDGTTATRYTPDTAAIAADDFFFIDISAITGAPTELHVTIRYTTT